ncbi:MAG: hypothetical protein ACR2OZ_11525 [Verrucomicrobiales bacterium]
MSLHVTLMNASRSHYGKSGKALSRKQSDPWLFWWTIAIFVLLGLATFSWFFSLYVFRHPENPKNYRLLSRVGKLEPLTKFNEQTVPQGKFLTPKEAYAKFFNYTNDELTAQNGLFKRNYIQNYAEQQPVYIKGEYRIYKVTELSPRDAFPSGLIVRAKARELPNVSIEFVLPADQLPKGRPPYGDDLILKTNDNFASILHVSRLSEDSLCLTVVPLTYWSYPVSHEEFISLTPPAKLNLDSRWPVTDDIPTPEAEKGRVAGVPGQ